ncbi:CD3337/EF1877 family mobilome membrane protein [Paenibacillus sp. MMO-177]|uniref:CD3337/EF1877 family mobilome membrane protein n=1 Tax=Paenibacillus sp. MMO-177 TaxID=3081289 RepID=UPI003019B79D
MILIGMSSRLLRSLLVVLFLLTVLLSTIAPHVSYAAGSMDEMIPQCPKGDASCTNKSEFSNIGASHYAFQTAQEKKSFWNLSGKANDYINSFYDTTLSSFFLIGVQITRFFSFIVREAFTFSYFNYFIDAVAVMITNLTGVSNGRIGVGLWGSLFGIFASFTLLYMLWQLVRIRFLDTLQTAITFLLVLVISLSFFSQAAIFMKFINDGAAEIGGDIYTALAKPGGLSPSTSQGITTMTDQVWLELIVKPYEMLQFDDSGMYENDKATLMKVLKTNPNSDDRNKALLDLKTKYPAVGMIRSAEQIVILLCASILGSIILGLMSYWAVMTIYTRMKFIIHASIMSITLLASLLPGRAAGLNVIRGQFIKLIGLGISTATTFFFLDLSLVMGHMSFDILYNKANAGWFVSMVVEAIMVVVVFKFRNEIGSVFSKAVGAIPMPQRAKNSVLDAVQRNVTRSIYNKAGESIGGMFNRKEAEGVPASFNPSAISRANDSVNDATTASMQLRYQREKDASEQLATSSGEPVQYTPYVQRVNENLQNNAKNPFRGMDKEWKEEKNRLKAVKEDGGDLKQAILSRGVQEGMNDQQVAATMYSNENAIRQASTFMVNRPKQAVNQMQRAGTLNKNRRLETSVDDFIMNDLFTRYRAEHNQAVQQSTTTGDPIKHTPFVNAMDQRFKAAGLITTPKINATMLSRKGRIGYASFFQSMPEYTQKRDTLLRANEAFMKASTPALGAQLITPTNVPFKAIGPISTSEVQSKMPSLPNAMDRRTIAPHVHVSAPLNTTVDLTKVTLPTTLKDAINISVAGLNKSVPGVQASDYAGLSDVEIKEIKEAVSDDLTTHLHTMNKQLKVMSNAHGSRVSEVDATMNALANKVKKNANEARSKKIKRVNVDD